ncbi:MAG: cytochrome C oxidase subunit IV family protein [Phycisphaeraceae bacterium]
MADHATTEHSTSGEEHHHGRYHPHVVPLPMLAGVFAALLALTVITVAVTLVDLGGLNLPVALLIAAVKASLVALYFMHLRWDSPFNAVALIAAFLFLALFLWFAIVDTDQYAPQMMPITEREGLVGPGG